MSKEEKRDVNFYKLRYNRAQNALNFAKMIFSALPSSSIALRQLVSHGGGHRRAAGDGQGRGQELKVLGI